MGRVDPIREEHTLIAVKKVLKQLSLREWALFAFGINAALRISDLLGLRVGDVVGSDGSIRDELDCTVAKTGRHLKVHRVVRKTPIDDLKLTLTRTIIVAFPASFAATAVDFIK